MDRNERALWEAISALDLMASTPTYRLLWSARHDARQLATRLREAVTDGACLQLGHDYAVHEGHGYCRRCRERF